MSLPTEQALGRGDIYPGRRRGAIVGTTAEPAVAAPLVRGPAAEAAGAFVLMEGGSALWIAYGLLLFASLVFWTALSPTASGAVTVATVQAAFTITMAALVCAGWGSLLLAAGILRSLPRPPPGTASPAHLVAAMSLSAFGGLNLAGAALLYVTLRSLAAGDITGYTTYEGVLFGLWVAAAIALAFAGPLVPRAASAAGLVDAKGRSLFPVLLPVSGLVYLAGTLAMALSLFAVLGSGGVVSDAVVVGVDVGGVLSFLVVPALAIATFALVLTSAMDGLRRSVGS